MADNVEHGGVGDGVGVGIGPGQVDAVTLRRRPDRRGLVGSVGVELELAGVAALIVDAGPAGDALVDAEVLGEVGDDLQRRRRDEEDLAPGVEVLLEQLEGLGVDDRGHDRLERLLHDAADPGLLPAPGDRQHLVAGPLHPRLVGAPEPVDRLVVGTLE